MKPKFRHLRSLAIASSALLSITYAQAADLYWDGATPAGAPGGGAGTWDTTATNWDTALTGGDTAWVNANLDNAIFGGTAGTVTLGTGITVGGLTFNTTGYGITTSGSTLNFGAANNPILFNNIAAASITGSVGGSGNVALTAANTNTSGTLTLTGTSTGGWSGTTTVNAGTILRTLDVDAATDTFNQALRNTSGITINGGTIQVSRHWGGTNLDYVNDSAAITVNGGGTFNASSITAGNAAMNENMGAVTVNSGQFFIGQPTGGSSGQRLTLASAPVINGTGSIAYMGALTTTARIVVSGTSATPAGQIIGPWATTGSAANNQNDYAVYDSSGFVVPANITASPETTWTTAANAYTLSTAAKTATALTATRNITALKASSTATATSSATTAGSPTFTIASGHSFNVGDPVMLSSLGGDFGANVAGQQFTVGTVYYVASVTGTTFTLAGTPGGTAINAGQARTPSFTGGLKLDNTFNLGTTGILNSGNAPLAIGRSATGGQLTLPTAGAGNLYVTTGLAPDTAANSGLNGRIAIDAPIVDNGGALTLVKNGASVLRLQAASTYTGGTVINAGTVTFTSDNNFGAANTAITFNGSGALSFGPNYSFGFAVGGTVPLSRPVTLNNGAIAGFYYNSPNTTMNISGAITGDGGIISGKDPVLTYNGGDGTIGINFTSTGNTFTGPLTINNATATFNSLADSSSPMILNAGFTYGSGASANLSIPNRLVDVRASTTVTNSAGSARTVTFGNISTTTSGAKTLTLNNANTNGAGFITGAITNGAGTIAITKTGTGTFTISGNMSQSGNVLSSGGTLIISGTNTYTGTTSPDNSILTIRGKNALPSASVISFDSGSSSAGQGGGRLNLYMDDSGTVALGNQINVRTAQTSGGVTAQWTIDVGNNGGATTGSTLALGKMNFASISDPRAGGYILNVTGANGYGLQIGDVDLAPSVGRDGGTGSGSFQPGQGFNPTTAPLTITGTVRQNAASVAASGVNVGRLVLWGSNAGNSITGAIMNPADFPGNANAKELGITKGSTGNWSLTNTGNTFTGAIVLSSTTTSAGTLSYASAGGANPITFSQTTGSATLSYTGAGQTMSGAITASALTTGTITLDASGSGAINYSNTGSLGSTGTLVKNLVLSGTNTGDNILAGAWVNNGTGAATLTKSGAGTWILASTTSSYTGATNVNAGKLLVNGTTGTSAFSVASGATLGGTGTIGGTVNVTGVLSPGASIETLGTGSLSFANGSTLAHELDSSVGTPVGSDLLKVTGNLNLVGTVGLTLADLATTDVAFTVNDVFSLINYTGSWNNGLFTLDANELTDEEVFSFGLNTWRISYNDATGGLNYLGEYAGGSDSFVNITVLTVIPEPSSVALLGTLGAMLLFRRRR